MPNLDSINALPLLGIFVPSVACKIFFCPQPAAPKQQPTEDQKGWWHLSPSPGGFAPDSELLDDPFWLIQVSWDRGRAAGAGPGCFDAVLPL